MILGTFWDYQITELLSGFDNAFTKGYYRFFEVLGEFAFTFNLVVITSFFCAFGVKKDKVVIKYVQGILNLLLAVFFSFMTFFARAAYLHPENGNSHGSVSNSEMIICIILGVIFALLMIKLMSKVNESDYLKYRKIAVTGIIFTLSIMLVINGIKYVWARPRYWYIVQGNATFVPWYVVNGKNISEVTNAYMSFVSGHTANAFASIYLALWLPKYTNKSVSVAVVWGFLTGISRLFAGQHFLTDITMGGVIVLLLFAISLKLTNTKLLIEE